MLGSAAFRASVTPGGALAGPWVRNSLWTAARAVPSLDLRFADNKSLVDATTGQNLVTFTRASSGTFVGSDGLIKTATTNLLVRSEEFDNASWDLAAGTRSANAAIAPSGTLTADKLIAATTPGTTGQLFQAFTITSGATVTGSLFVKDGGFDRLEIVLLSNNNTTPYGRATFNPITGTITTAASTANGGTNASANVVAYTNGWYRLSVTVTYPAVTAAGMRILSFNSDGAVGDGSKGVFLWGAQVEQSSTAGEYIPTTSTINSAPRFDHNPTTGESLGLLVEEQRTNSIRNNTMVGAVAGTPGTLPTNWVTNLPANGISGAVSAIGTENGITYIDYRISGTASADIAPVIRFEANNNAAASSGQSWTASLYAKLTAGSLGSATLIHQLRWTDSGGSVLSTVNIGAAFTPTGSALGGQRYSATGTAIASTAFVSQLLATSTITNGSTVDLTLRIGLPQLEQGAFATSVIPTSTVAVTRSADVASITGANFGTTRTNLLLQSNQFDTTWTNSFSSETAASGTAPDGTNTAWELKDTSDVSATAHSLSQNYSYTTGTTYTFSVWMKAGTLTEGGISVPSAAFGAVLINRVNLTTGAVISTTAGSTTVVTPFANGWYRVSLTATATATASGNAQIRPMNGGTTYIGTGTGTILIWGAQLEVGSAVTPYIPTTSATVSVFDSSWYRQDEGTVFADNTSYAINNTRIASFSDNTASNRVLIARGSGSGGNINITVTVDGTVQVSSFVFASSLGANTALKVAGGFKASDFAGSVNGAAPTTRTSGSMATTVNQLGIGNGEVLGTNTFSGTIRRLVYWPQRLSNSTLQQITQ
jgi:hypothetical protein